MRSKILAALSALAIALGMVAFTTTTASAHHNTITASVACDTTIGKWVVTWSVTNSENDKSEEIISSSNTDVVAIGETFTAGQTRTFTQTVSAKTDLTLTLKGKWSNGVKTENTGKLWKSSFKGDCVVPPTPVTGNAVAFGEQCVSGVVTKGYLQVTIKTGVVYTITKKGSNTAIPFNATTGKTGLLNAGDYVVTAKAADGYTLNLPKEWKLTIAGAGTCTPPPCLDKSAVSYTYDATTNSGVITVAAKAGSSTTLCKPFWVVAASWKFIGNTMWPQQLDKWNPATGVNLNTSTGAIDKVGVYNYAANVDCGQGDIYATFNAPGVPTVDPPQILTASKTPYPEHFLHQMGFSGPNPTYTVQNAGACNAVTAGVVFQGYECNTFGPLVLSGTHVTFTVKYDDAPGGSVSGVVPGSYELLANFAAQTGPRYFGQVTVTVQADPGYTLLSVGTPVPLTANTALPNVVKTATMQTTWILDANLPQDCPTVLTVVPDVTFLDECGTANDKVTVPVQTGVAYTTTDTRVGGIGTVTVNAAPSSSDYVFANTVTTTSWSFDFTNEPCPVKVEPLTPGAFDPTCPEEPDAQSGYIQLDLKTGLNYFIDGVATTTAKNDRAPGTYTISVTVDAGYELVGPDEWELIVAEPFCPPTLALLSTTASMSNLTCKAAGSYTLAATAGIAWFVNGSATATPAGTYQKSTPGVVTVEAKIIDPINDGWEDNAQTNWTFTFTNPVDCLPTLAFTGSNGGNLGLLLSGGLLLFGGTIIAFERRFRREVG